MGKKPTGLMWSRSDSPAMNSGERFETAKRSDLIICNNRALKQSQYKTV